MNKVIVFLLLCIFLISFASAFEFDNVLEYDEQTREAHIYNCDLWIITCLNRGDEIGKAKLNTPLNVVVPRGYQKVAEFDLWAYEDYNDALKQFSFSDMKKGKEKINRDYDLKMLGYEDVLVDDYSSECLTSSNGTEVCTPVISGSHIEQREKWTKITTSDLKQNDIITVGVFTEVQVGDFIDWIPMIYGFEISQWATWTESLSASIVQYYNFDQSSGTALPEVTGNYSDGQLQNMVDGDWVTGILGNALNFDGSNDYVLLDNAKLGKSITYTYNIWFRMSNKTTASAIISETSLTDADTLLQLRTLDDDLDGFIRGDGGAAALMEGTTDVSTGWHMATLTRNGNVFRTYVDGSFESTDTVSIGVFDSDVSIIGAFDIAGSLGDHFKGDIDEAGLWNRTLTDPEIIDLYNGGTGLTFPAGVIITLNSPENNFITINPIVTLNATVDQQLILEIINVSLLIDGVINETNTSGFSGDYIFIKTLSTGEHNWSIRVVDNETSTTNSSTRNFTIDNEVPQIDVESPVGELDYNFIGGNETLNITFTDSNLDTCWYNYNGTNITIDGCITGVKNSTEFILEEDNFNMTLYANDTLGNENSTFIEWSYRVLEINRTFETSAFETDSQTFSINLSSNSSLTSVNLIYDNISKTTTLSNNISTVTFDIPASTGTKELFWSFIHAGETINSTTSNQNVDNLDFIFCNSTINVPYINFSFKNETINQEQLSATIDSSWNFWLGSGTEVKSITLTNSTENVNYIMCSSASNDTLFTSVTLNYNNAQSQQRSFTSEPILTNSTTQQTLFLLPSTLGLFTQFQTRDIANNPISLVKGVISRTIDSSVVTISSFFTDSSGLVIFFLNPDVVYTATFSKSGLVDNTFTFVPTTDLRFVTMGTGVTVNGSNISIGTLYEITPVASILTNDTLTTFGFNVSGSEDITSITMNITDGNGTSFAFESNAGVGFISTILNTSQNQTLTGIFNIITGDETLTVSKIWTIGNEFEGDYSISKQGRLFLQYDFSDFIRFAMVILIMFGVVIFMSSNELADNNESKIAVIVLMIWGFSAIGWLNNPAVVSTTGIAQYSKQYGIAILSTAGSLFFFIRRIFV